jgi:hypothetical protein
MENTMGLRAVVACVFMICSLAAAQTQSPEEKEIRQTYARVSLAAQIGAVQNAVFDGKDLANELENNRVEFRLSDFRVGNVADHRNELLKDFHPRPNGEDRLQINPGTQGHSREAGGSRFESKQPYADVKWQGPFWLERKEWDTITLGTALDLTLAHDGERITRFATYLVQTTFRGKTQTTRAVWWYGTDKNGKPIVNRVDDFNNGSSAVLFLTNSLYPAIFLEDPMTRNNPAVVQWLNTVAQDCPGGKHENCYDEAADKAGISREDIERGPLVTK